MLIVFLKINYYFNWNSSSSVILFVENKMKGVNKMNTKEYVKIAELLNEFCIPKHLLGYRMILNAIYILSQESNISVLELYERVAKMNNSNVSRTERAIRYAIEEAYENCKMYNINTFKRVSYANGKPSNHEFLKALCFEYELSQV